MTLDFTNDLGSTPVLSFGAIPGGTMTQLDKIRAGLITVIACPKRDYDDYGKALPQAGEYGLVVDMEGKPAIVVKVKKVAKARFLDIDEATAKATGEENKDRWISNNRAKIACNGGWSAFMDMVFCQFEFSESL